MNRDDTTLAALFCEAIDHRQFNRLDDAEECLDRLLEINPVHVPALNEKGVIYMARGKLDEAIVCFDRILKEAPTDPYALNRLGATHRQRGCPAEAIHCFQGALKTNDCNTHVLSELALTHYQLGHEPQAAHYFKEAERYRNFGNQISGLVAHLATRTTPGVAVAGLAHEVNNVLDSMHMTLALAVSDLDEPSIDRATINRRLGQIRDGADRIHRLVGHFGKLARKDIPQDDEVSIQQLVEFAFDLLGEKLRGKGISWDIRVSPEDLPHISCNQLELEQVFVNLVSNAYEALSTSVERKPHITVEIGPEEGGQGITVRFSDNGPGIPTDVASRVFEFYFSTKNTGTGVGLWLCQFAIERAGGSIELETSLDKGTTFIINLPMQGERHAET